jgi:O-antigen/teichoic acid export membrane protein
MLIGVAITIALITLPALLFPVLLGPNWTGAVEYAQAMAPSIGLGFMVSPLSFVFDAYQKAAAQFALDISRVVLVFGLGYWAYRSGWGAIGATWAMYAGQVANYALTWILGLTIVSGKDRSPTPLNGEVSA